jgi:hypothetical protein
MIFSLLVYVPVTKHLPFITSYGKIEFCKKGLGTSIDLHLRDQQVTVFFGTREAVVICKCVKYFE